MKVAILLTSCSRQTSLSVRPASTAFKIVMIWCSLNLALAYLGLLANHTRSEASSFQWPLFEEGLQLELGVNTNSSTFFEALVRELMDSATNWHGSDNWDSLVFGPYQASPKDRMLTKLNESFLKGTVIVP